MRGALGLLILLIGSLNAQVLTNQWVKYSNYNDATSLASNNNSIVWMGTKGGLVRWDIQNNIYKIFDKSNGLPSEIINDINFDSKGNLWLATNNGIVKFDRMTFKLYNYQNSPIPDAPFTKIVIDSEDNVYAAMGWYLQDNAYQPGGIIKLSNDKWVIFNNNDDGKSGQANPPTDLIIYHDTVLACVPYELPGAWQTHIYYLVNDFLTNKNIPNINFYPNKFAIDFQDSLWLSCSPSLYKYRNAGWEEIFNNGSIVWSNGFDGLWLADGPMMSYINLNKTPISIKSIFYVSNTDSIGNFTDHLALSLNQQCFTNSNGLYILNNLGVLQKHFQIPKTVSDNNIYGLGINPQNDVLVSTGYSTQRFDGSNWINIGDEYNGQRTWNSDFCFTPNDSLFTNHNKIYGMWDSYSGFTHGVDVDLNGNIWTAYGDLIEYLWPGLIKKEYSLDNLGLSRQKGYWQPQLMDVTIDKFNHVWAVGWYDGAVMFDGSKWNVYHSTDVGLQYGWNADYIFTDSKGRVWFTDNQSSPNEGIVLNDNGKWSILNFNGYYSASYVYQIAEDNFGNLWFATQAGVLEYDGNNWYLINSKNSELDSDVITAITVDQRGNIWIGTQLGLYGYNPKGLDFNSDITSSPGDIRSVEKYESGAKVRFAPKESPGSVFKYELQRGRLPFKYWTTSSIIPSGKGTDTLELIDSSIVSGDSYYRIKMIDRQGRALYSPGIKFTGSANTFTATDFKGVYFDSKYVFTWQTSNEYYISYYEVTKYDSASNKDSILAYVKPKNNGSENNYKAAIDYIEYSKQPIEFRLIAVFADSTRQVLSAPIFALSIPDQFEVSQNYPNPFNGQTFINFNLLLKSIVEIRVYNILGKLVRVPLRKEFEKGYYTQLLDFSDLASGVYIYEVIAGSDRAIRKMILLK